mmetsp:Transcript_13928/g.20063  ORF Transcript_13928/g.20063 Transcript_13928/m.20063 type:complete len:138 (-) Transcript_13928:69-482(-)
MATFSPLHHKVPIMSSATTANSWGIIQTNAQKGIKLHPKTMIMITQPTPTLEPPPLELNSLSLEPHGYGDVWYDPNRIATVLSLKHVSAKYDIVYDTRGTNSFIVIKPDRETVSLIESEAKLYYLDTDTPKNVAMFL